MYSFQTTIQETSLTFETHPDLFSPRRADAGTLAMLKTTELNPGDKVLDLGCGYGLVGIYAAKILEETDVWMLDSNLTAVRYAQRNAVLNNVPTYRFHSAMVFATSAKPDSHESCLTLRTTQTSQLLNTSFKKASIV